MYRPKSEGRATNPWQLVGKAPDEADVTFDGQSTTPNEAETSSEPKVWYVRLGQAISGLFSSIGDKFTALWRGVSNAADAVARFFSTKDAASDLEVATKHIKEPSAHLQQQEFSGSAQLSSSPTVYFSVPENTKNEDITQERRGLLGAIPVKPPTSAEDTEKTEEVKPAPAPISPGREKFEAYLAARDEAKNVLDYALDEDCAQHTDEVFQLLFKLQSTPGYQLSTDQKLIYDAAKEIRSARSDYNKKTKEEEQKKIVEAERARQAEEAARKQPGQADFEEFVATFNRHRDENTPFMIYEGSKYLQDACLEYGWANLKNFSADQQSALRYLTCWREDPRRSKQLLEQARHFISLDEVERQASTPTVAMTEHLPLDSSKATDLDESPAPPPPRPVPRWISMLLTMKPWDSQQIERIAGVLTLQEDQVRKAMDGLRTIAKLASTSGVPAARNAGGAHTIEQVLNYDAESSRQASDLLESLELASRLVKRLSAGDALVFDQPEKEFFNTLKNVIGNVTEALDKKLAELLPARPRSAAQGKIRIPSLAELTDSEAKEGARLFETYVAGYAKRSNSVGYALPEKSNYFKPECLAYAKAFTDQVERMQGAVVVDDSRLAASYYLLTEARKRGLIAA